MTIRRSVLAGVLSVPLVLAACSTDDQGSSSTTSSTTTTASSTTSSTTTPAEVDSNATPQPTPAQEPAAQPAEPTLGFTCETNMTLYEPGTTWYDDGTSGYEQSCFDQTIGDARAIADANPYLNGQDPATVPIPDGGTCPAYLCGYGHDENGNPNPSSGEIQGWWMDCIATNDESYCRENDPYT